LGRRQPIHSLERAIGRLRCGGVGHRGALGETAPLHLASRFLFCGLAPASPYLLFYDLCILTVAAAFLVRDGLSRGFLPGERTAIMLCWFALFLVKMPIGAVVCSVMAFLCIRRIIVSRKDPALFAVAVH
jgi:hypothetical protein